MRKAPGSAKALVERIKKDVVEHDQDAVVLLVGKEGSGKSTVAIRLAKLMDASWRLREDCFWDGWSYIRASKRKPEKKALVMDEGADSVFAQDWQSGENKEFMKHVYKARKLNQYHIVCFPDKEKVSSTFDDWRVQYRLECLKNGQRPAGVFVVQEPDGRGHWKEIARIPFDDLSETNPELWERYQELAKGQVRKGEGEDSVPPGVRAMRRYRGTLEPLADRMKRVEAEESWEEMREKA